MAEIQLDFGVNVGDYQKGSMGTIKKQLDAIISRLPVFNINVRISDESIKGVKSQIELIRQELSGDLINNTESIQKSTGIQAELKQTMSELSQTTEGTKTAFSELRTSIVGDLEAIKQSINETFTNTALDGFAAKVAEIKSVMATATAGATTASAANTAKQVSQVTKEQAQAEKEAIQTETALGVATQKTSQEKEKAARSTRVMTDAEKEEQKAVMDTLSLTIQLFNAEKQLSQLFEKNVNANDLVYYKDLRNVFEKITEQASLLRAGLVSIEEVFSELGVTGPEYFKGLQTIISGLSAEIQVTGTGGTLKSGDIYSLMDKLQAVKENTPLPGRNETYDILVEKLGALRTAMKGFEEETKQEVLNVDSLKEHLNQAGIEGKSSIEEIVTLMDKLKVETGQTSAQAELLLKVRELRNTMITARGMAERQNSSILDTDEYRNVTRYLNQFKNAIDAVDAKGGSISEVFKKSGTDIVTAMRNAKTAVSDLNAVIKETEKETVTKSVESPLKTLEQVQAKIASLTKTLEAAKGKNIGIISTEEFSKVNSYLDTFNKAVNLVETAKLKGEVLTLKDAFALLNTTLEEVVSESNIAVSQLSVAMTQIEKADTPINKLQSQLESLQRQRDKSGPISGTDKYTNLAIITRKFEDALRLVENEGLRVDEAISKVGLDVDSAFSKAKAAIGAAKLEMYNFNQEMLSSGISENALRKSLINLEGLQFRGDNNTKAQASQEYKNLADIIGKVQTALGLVETKSLDVDRALKSVGLDGSTYMEQVSNITSKFNLVLIETDNEAKKANAALKEQQTAIKEEDALVKQTYSSIQSMTNLLKQASGKGLTAGVDYDRLSMYLNLMNKMRAEYETYSGGGMANAFEKIGGSIQNLPRFFKDAELAALQLKVAIAETTTEENHEKDTTLSLLDAYKLLAKAKSMIYNNEAFKSEGSYKSIVADINDLQTAVLKVEGGCKDLDTAFKETGKNGVQIAEQLKIKMAELNNVMTMPDSKMAVSAAVSKQTTLENLISTNANKSSVVNSDEYKYAQEMATRLAEAIRLVRTEGTGINTISQAFMELNKAEGEAKLSAEGIALAIADLKRISGGNDLETKIMTAYKAMSKLKTEAEQYIAISNSGKVAGFSAGNLAGSSTYSQFITQFQTIENAINAIAQGGTTADNVLKNLTGTETQLFANITLLSSQMQAELKKLSAAYKDAETNARAEGQAERSRQTELRRASTLLASMTKAQEKWTAAATGKSSNYYKNIEGYVNNLRAAMNEFNSGSINQSQFSERVRNIGNAFRETSTAIAQAGENTVSFTSRISNVVQRFGAWFGITRVIMKVISSIKQLISASIELDDAFTQLQIVTQSTEATYKNFGNTVAEVAKRTAVSMTDITNAATTYARLGYSLEEAAKLAEYTAKLQNVGDIESSDAQDAVTAILKAYDEIDADHIEEVMNKLITTGNNFPISVAQIAEGMNNASSALAAAGNTFEQSVALLTAANTTVQDAAKSSTALRTITARIRKTDTELDDLGETMEQAKYDKLIKALADLDIALVDVNNEYRSTYDIMKDIAGKWESLTSMEQAALAETIAGTRQQSIFYSLIENFQEASGAMEAMAGSAGALETAYDTYLDSTTAHINQFKASWQALGADLFNSEMLSKLVDLGNKFVGLLDTLTKMKLLIPTLITGGLVKKLITITTTTAAQTAQAKQLAAAILQQKGLTDQLSLSVAGLNKKQIALVQSTIQRTAATNGLNSAEATQLSNEIAVIGANAGVTASNAGVAASFRAVAASIPGWGILLMALTGVIAIVGNVAQAVEEAKQKFSEDTKAIKEDIGALEEYKKKIEEIEKSEATQAERLTELNKIREALNTTFDSNIAKTENERQAVAALNKELEAEIRNRRDIYLAEHESDYEAAKKEMEDMRASDGSWWGGTTYAKNVYSNTYDIFSKFRKNVDKNNISKELLSLFDVRGNGQWENFSFRSTNTRDLIKEYEDAILVFNNVRKERAKFNKDLNKDEQLLYDNLIKNLKNLKEAIGEGGIDYENRIKGYATEVAQSLIDANKQGTKSAKEWRDELIALANEDEYVIEAIRELVQDTEGVPSVVSDVLDEINEAVKQINGQLDSLKTNMQTAKDYFEDLAKTIKTNDDADKFFTSAEIIDLLDKYPELSNAILETTYGYKIEAQALEDLRQTKLKEQKDALAAQIVETESAIESVQQRLNAYAKEIEGVKNLEEAKTELAMVEAQLARINSSTAVSPELLNAWTGSIEKRKRALSGWIETNSESDVIRRRAISLQFPNTVMCFE